MSWIRQKMKDSPMLARVLPFLVFLGLTGLQSKFGETGLYWVYLAKTIVGAWLIWVSRPYVAEMRWEWSWRAMLIGVGVCVIWVGLDPYYPRLWAADPKSCWNPVPCLGETAGWFFIMVRIVGSSLVVPPLEETFYRSFIYRKVANPDFEKASLTHFLWMPFLVTSVIFGLGHTQWLAGILCGFAYQWLVLRTGRLGEAMTAHAVTNFLLGVWVVWRGDWKFW